MANQYVVIRYNCMVDQGQRNTDQKKVERGSVSVTLSNGQKYTWGCNQCQTLPEPFGTEALAADNRLSEVSRS